MGISIIVFKKSELIRFLKKFYHNHSYNFYLLSADKRRQRVKIRGELDWDNDCCIAGFYHHTAGKGTAFRSSYQATAVSLYLGFSFKPELLPFWPENPQLQETQPTSVHHILPSQRNPSNLRATCPMTKCVNQTSILLCSCSTEDINRKKNVQIFA